MGGAALGGVFLFLDPRYTAVFTRLPRGEPVKGAPGLTEATTG